MAILTGSVVGRMRFTPLAIFVVFWLLFVYYPFAHMVWDEGLLAKWGTIDFAGGDVIHITSGVSALVLAIVVGKRRDFGILEHRPHNVPSYWERVSYGLVGLALMQDQPWLPMVWQFTR